MTIDELRAEMLHGFGEIRAEIHADHETTRRQFDTDREATRRQFDEIRAQIKAEGETTRRHFDMMVERMADSVKVVAEATAHHATRIDNHEARLNRLERPRRR